MCLKQGKNRHDVALFGEGIKELVPGGLPGNLAARQKYIRTVTHMPYRRLSLVNLTEDNSHKNR